MDHAGIHAPEHQKGRHIHRGRPACYVPMGPVGTRGAAPGQHNPFHDQGITCGCATTAATWFSLLASTPDCLGCMRGRAVP